MYQAEQFLDALAHALAQWPVFTPVDRGPPDGPMVFCERVASTDPVRRCHWPSFTAVVPATVATPLVFQR